MNDIPLDAKVKLLPRAPLDFVFWVPPGAMESESFVVETLKSRFPDGCATKPVFMTRGLLMDQVWVRPKPPSKRAGRRGTRRAWKRANPPSMTTVPVGVRTFSLPSRITSLLADKVP